MVELDQLLNDCHTVAREPGCLTTDAADAFLHKHPLESIYQCVWAKVIWACCLHENLDDPRKLRRRKLSQDQISTDTIATLASVLEKLFESGALGMYHLLQMQ